uniref:Nudix hydrolase domain-containing protein n=1 Tax=Arion vulgaris TaxID=1028688 RepID=A0A0B7AVV4_9EUPU
MRVLVKLHKKDFNPKLAEFSECILSYFESTDGTANLYIELKDNYLIVSNFSLTEHDKVVIKHSTCCPMLHLNPDIVSLPKEISTRGVDVGVAILVESSDGKILLSRRPLHLRIFPGVWVPPGGHIEENETVSTQVI